MHYGTAPKALVEKVTADNSCLDDMALDKLGQNRHDRQASLPLSSITFKAAVERAVP